MISGSASALGGDIDIPSDEDNDDESESIAGSLCPTKLPNNAPSANEPFALSSIFGFDFLGSGMIAGGGTLTTWYSGPLDCGSGCLTGVGAEVDTGFVSNLEALD